MFYPFFSAAFAISAYYLTSKKNLVPKSFDRTEYQISKLFYDMGFKMARHGLDTLDKVTNFYSGQHAPQLIEMMYNSITKLDPLPNQYIHPRISLFTAENNLKFAVTVLADYSSQTIFKALDLSNNIQNFYSSSLDNLEQVKTQASTLTDYSILSEHNECDPTHLITQVPFDKSFQALLIPVAISAHYNYGIAYLILGLDFSIRHLSCLLSDKTQESPQTLESSAQDSNWKDYLVEATDNTYFL